MVAFSLTTRWALSVVFLTTVLGASAAEGSTVVVETADGRTLAGIVDSQTDRQTLWLRRESSRMLVTMPVAWTAIATATLDGAAIDWQQLQDRAPSLVEPAPKHFLSRPSDRDPPGEAPLVHRGGVVSDDSTRGRERVVAVAVDAHLIHLDRDVEHDGIALAIGAVTNSGTLVPVRGNLAVRLVVERNDSHTGQRRYENAQRWTRAVEVDDFIDGTACFRLPFRTVAPEHDLQLRSQGMINVRLSAAGQGNFEASTGLSIRQLHPFRDSVQLDRGRRFVENELTAPVERALPLPPGQRAAPWTPYHLQGVSF